MNKVLAVLFFAGILMFLWLVIYTLSGIYYAISASDFMGDISRTPKVLFLFCFLIFLGFKKGVLQSFDELIKKWTDFLLD